MRRVVESVNVRFDEDKLKDRQNIVNRSEESYVEEEAQSESEQEEEALRKSPNKYVNKNHLEDQIIGNKNDCVQTRRRTRNNEQVNFFLMTEMEPKTYDEANKSDK